MKTLTLGHLLIVCALPLSFACAKKKDEKKVEPVIAAPKLEGDYASTCNGSDNSYRIAKLRFGQAQLPDGKLEDRVMVSNLDFNGQGCAELNLAGTSEATYKYTVGAHRGGLVFDAYMEDVEFAKTPATPATAEIWNDQRKCDINDWSAGLRRVVDVRSRNCVSGQNEPGRPAFTVFKIEGNTIALGTKTPGQDGWTAERRQTTLGATYTKANTVAPVPVNPVACPNLSGTYACTRGDSVYGDNDLIISTSAETGVIQVGILKNNQLRDTVFYRPREGERTVPTGELRTTKRETCEGNVLRALEQVYRNGDLPNRDETVRELSADARGLNVTTRSLRYTDNRPGREARTDTQCVRR